MSLQPHHLQQQKELEERKRLQLFDAEEKMFGNVDEDYELPIHEKDSVHVRLYRYELIPGQASNIRHERMDKFTTKTMAILEQPGEIVYHGWDGIEYLHDPRREQKEVLKPKRAVKKKTDKPAE